MKRLASIASGSSSSGSGEETREGASVVGLPTHEEVYRRLREQILFGGIRPGSAVTLRGLADALGVSSMPVREAVRRLIAERALLLHVNRRVSVAPTVSAARTA